MSGHMVAALRAGSVALASTLVVVAAFSSYGAVRSNDIRQLAYEQACVPAIPSPQIPPGPNNPGTTCLPASSDEGNSYPVQFSPGKAATWADSNWENIAASDWRDKSVGNHCAEFVSSALHAGGLPYTGDWRSNSAERPWELKSKRAYCNARSLRNWLVSNGWVDDRTLSKDQNSSGIADAAPGDVIFYDWTSKGNDRDVHTAIVVDMQDGVPIVVDQGSGQDHTRRPWNISGLEPHIGQLINSLPDDQEFTAELLHWR